VLIKAAVFLLTTADVMEEERGENQLL